MFITASTATYLAPVSVTLPGEKKSHTFKARFKRLDQDEIASLTSRAREGDLSDAKLIDEVLVGWEDVSDSNGDPLEFSAENLASALAIYPVSGSIVKAYFDSLNTAKK